MKSLITVYLFVGLFSIVGCNRFQTSPDKQISRRAVSSEQVSNVRLAMKKIGNRLSRSPSQTSNMPPKNTRVHEQVVKGSKFDQKSYAAAKAAFATFQATPYALNPKVLTCSTINDPAPSSLGVMGTDFYTQSSLDVVQAAQSLSTAQAMSDFVRFQIANEVLFGATRSASKTLSLKSGSVADKANLLVAMLRSSEIPSYFVQGTVYLKDSVMKRLLGVSDTTSVFAAMISLTSSSDPTYTDTSQFYTVINGETYWMLPHLWVRAYFDGSWQSLDPTQPADVFSSLQQNPYFAINTFDWDYFWSNFFFLPDQNGNYIKQLDVVDFLTQEIFSTASSTPPPPPPPNQDINLGSGILDEQRIGGVLSNLTPCATGQAFGLQGSPYEYTASFTVTKYSTGTRQFTYTAPLAEMSEGLTYLSHTAGLSADGVSGSGDLQFRVNDAVVEDIPTVTIGTQYQLSGAITAPSYWSTASSQTVTFNNLYNAGDVFHFNVFAGKTGTQSVDSSMNDILQAVNASELDGATCSEASGSGYACDRFIMARLMRGAGVLAANKAELINQDIRQLWGVNWVPGGISGTYVTGTGFSKEGTTNGLAADEFGIDLAGGTLDTESAGLISLPTIGDVFSDSFLSVWSSANNAQLVAVDQEQALIWEELYGIEGFSASRVLQYAAQLKNAGTSPLEISLLGVPLLADNAVLFSEFGRQHAMGSLAQSSEALINSYGPGGEFWGLNTDVTLNCVGWDCDAVGGFIVFPAPGQSVPSGGGSAYSRYSATWCPLCTPSKDGDGSGPLASENQGNGSPNANGEGQGGSIVSSIWNSLKSIVPGSMRPADSSGGGADNTGTYMNPADGSDIQVGSPVDETVPLGACPSSRSPVNVATGLMWHTTTDFNLLGRTAKTPLKFMRTYYTLPQYQSTSGWVGVGDFGPGWISNYDMRILDGGIDPTTHKLTMNPLGSGTTDVVWISKRGNPILFKQSSGYTSPASFPAAKLVAPSGSNTFTLTLPGDIVYTFKNDVTSNFNGRLLSIQEPHGESVSFVYDSQGRLQTASTILSGSNLTGTLTFVRDMTTHRVTSVTASNGNLVYTYAYDSSANHMLTSSTDFDGHTTAYQYDSGTNLLASMTDPIGRVTSFSYYQNGKVFQETDHGGAVQSFQYAPYSYDMYSQVTYPNGSTVQFHYDNSFRVTETVYPDNGRAFQSWTAAGRLAQQTDQLGRTTKYTYDTLGNTTGVQKFLDGDANYRQMAWDPTFHVPTSITPLVGSPTTIQPNNACTGVPGVSDCTGDILSVSRSTGSSSYTYDSLGKLLATNNGYNTFSNLTNSNGQTVFVYDNRNPQTVSYDSRGRVHQMQEANGRTIVYSYDNYDRVTLMEDTSGPTIANIYDAVGRLVETDRIGGGTKQVSTFEYDDRDRMIASTNFNSERTEYKYDVVGVSCGVHDAPTQVTTPDGKVMRFIYDSAGRVVQKILPNGGTVSYEYDLAGQLVAVADPQGLVTQFAYDGNGRLSEQLSQSATSKAQSNGTQISSGLEKVLYSYDAADRLTMKQQALANEVNGVYVTQYTYDGYDRMATKTITHSLSGKVVQTFDTISYSYLNMLDQSLLASVSNLYEVLTFNYQTQPPFSLVGFSVTPTTAGVSLGLQANTFRVTPDMNGPTAQVAQNGMILVKNGYDTAGRLISAMGTLGSTSFGSTLSYDAFGRLSTISDSSGLAGVYGYDNADRIASIGWSGAGLSMSESLTRTPAGLVAQDVREIGTFAYGYTADNQVSSISYGGSGLTGPWVNGSLTFDSSGNMLSTAAGAFTIYDNFVTAYNGTSYWPDYSGLGRLAGTTQGSNASSLTFNPDGRLLQLDQFSGGNSISAANYYYDGLGRRIAKAKTFASDTASSVTYIHFGLEDRVLLAQVTKGGSSAVTLFVDGQGADQHLFEINSSTGSQGFMTDHLGSVINSSAIGGKSAYGLFGENLGTAVPTNSGTEALSYGFAGREYDPESAYYYSRARTYDPSMARFLTKDPIGPGSGGQTNSYQYAGNSPINATDPTGKDYLLQIFGGLVGAGMNYYQASNAGYTGLPLWESTAVGFATGAISTLGPFGASAGAALNNFGNQYLLTNNVNYSDVAGAGGTGLVFGVAGVALGRGVNSGLIGNLLTDEGADSLLGGPLGLGTGLTSLSGIPSSSSVGGDPSTGGLAMPPSTNPYQPFDPFTGGATGDGSDVEP